MRVKPDHLQLAASNRSLPIVAYDEDRKYGILLNPDHGFGVANYILGVTLHEMTPLEGGAAWPTLEVTKTRRGVRPLPNGRRPVEIDQALDTFDPTNDKLTFGAIDDWYRLNVGLGSVNPATRATMIDSGTGVDKIRESLKAGRSL